MLNHLPVESPSATLGVSEERGVTGYLEMTEEENSGGTGVLKQEKEVKRTLWFDGDLLETNRKGRVTEERKSVLTW